MLPSIAAACVDQQSPPPSQVLLLPDLVNGESEVSDISNNCLVAEIATHRITLALQFITKSVMAWGPFGILESLGEFPNAQAILEIIVA